MRKAIVLALVIITASFGVPAHIFAQASASAQAGTISGEVLDAGGRAVVNQRVELIQGHDVVKTVTTGGHGEWMFANVPSGDYVVRIVMNGQVSGIRVSVMPGQAVTHALIVAASAATPSAAFLGGLGPVFGTIVIGGIAAAVITTVVLVTGS